MVKTKARTEALTPSLPNRSSTGCNSTQKCLRSAVFLYPKLDRCCARECRNSYRWSQGTTPLADSKHLVASAKILTSEIASTRAPYPTFHNIRLEIKSDVRKARFGSRQTFCARRPRSTHSARHGNQRNSCPAASCRHKGAACRYGLAERFRPCSATAC